MFGFGVLFLGGEEMSCLHGGTGREMPLSCDLRAHLESESRSLSRQPAPVRTASFLDVLGGTPHPSISSIPMQAGSANRNGRENAPSSHQAEQVGWGAGGGPLLFPPQLIGGGRESGERHTAEIRFLFLSPFPTLCDRI